ncbi:hypothetical protein H6F70_16845 [Coleofasciculus sp. FACHB-T130]|nr:hypothetical protein [Coleofasciculus sp. FACHB-501]MBD1880524.1 hypothetical protein [Coleofasciculus sp. FACHB-T130]MBD1895599.1 hypothetical protein [Coleofasciculus sp. FACHB-129]MBD2087498.1 hypothetical protein [Coleofasciculus sp. FACHB-542]MBD2538390.1 hypothetical protein [Coleofasciculus sp. FACHB-SPT36]
MLRFAVASLTALFLFPWGSIFDPSSSLFHLSEQPAIAQMYGTQDVWRQVYQRLPDLPLENQYISKETGKQASENTLVGRIIRYHVYVKSRPPNYRLDWKLTLADYLGANELIQESLYPGYDTLQKNPMQSDRAVIERLNRAQRDALVQVLVSLFTPNSQQQAPVPSPSASPQPQAAPKPSGGLALPQPGDAQLLK